jgi:hypothetical protein
MDTPEIEAARPPETLVSFCNSTLRHNPQDFDSNLHRCENLKSRIHIVCEVQFSERAVCEIKLSLCLTKYHAMKTYRKVEVYPCAFLTSELGRGEWSASRFSRFTPDKIVPAIN